MITGAEELPKDLQILLDEYIAAYEDYKDDATANQMRLGLAQAPCRALLEHYFPENEGYAVRPSTLGPMTKYDLKFMLKDANGKSPDYKPLKNPDRNPKLAAERELKCALKEKNWYSIPPENMTGFEVSRKVVGEDSDDREYRTHMYLAIMIADPKTYPLIASTNDAGPWDVLTEVICGSRQIRTGYGVLLYGTHLGIYDYDDNGGKLILDADGRGGTNITEEATVKLAQWGDGRDMVLDLRHSNLQELDALLKEAASKTVNYLNGSGERDGWGKRQYCRW